ncbi:conserved exported hypothetical protein [Gammaproteobacteria bacterium]
MRLCNRLVFFFLMALLGLAALPMTAIATPSYTVNNDGTVTDSTTGLTWKRCAEGQTWTGTTCTGSATAYTWDQANARTSTFAGYSDWRLPNIRELQTIVDRTVYSPAIDRTVFPNAPESNCWSASALAGYSNDAWSVDFGNGYAGSNSKNHSFPVRLVRGGQSFSLLGLSRPSTDYSDNGGGTVVHTPTGLIWKRCSEGQTWTGSTCSGDATTYTWDEAVTLTGSFAGHDDWRVPTEEELISLVDYTIRYPGPTINNTWFPNTPASYFWSASADANVSASAWFVHFDYGYAHNLYKFVSFQVRLVRGGQSFGFLALAAARTGTGNGTITSSPAGINCGSDCSEDYSSGTSVTLTATPASGSQFTGWSGDCSNSGNTCTVDMTAAKDVTASFALITYSLTINKSGSGSGTVTSSPSGINCGTGCATSVRSYNGGTSVTLTASAASGSTFAGWSGSGCSGTGTCTVALSTARTVTASFKANQTISALTFAPATLTVGGTTTASATATSSLAVTFSSTTPSICTVNGRTVTAVSAGTCTIAANQTGNANYNAAPRITRNLTIAIPRPDFVVTGITLTPPSPTANGTFSVNVTVRNQGTAAGDGGQLVLWTNQALDQNCDTPGDRTLAVGTLAVGASRVLTVSGLAAGSAGNKTLHAAVDNACAIGESNEINNQRSQTYTVVPPPSPDLVVTGITLTTSPMANGTFSARVTVRNQGTVDANGGKLIVWANQPTTQGCASSGNNSATLGLLSSGVDTIVNFSSLPAGSAGSKTFRAFVDSNCAITESNETNNQRTLTYTVR